MNETLRPTHINLNMDILLAILSFSPPKTATSIMTTCRFLYHEGAKVILRRPIRLYGSEHDLPTLHFIQAEDLSRCAYVRHLSILSNGYYSEAVAGILVDIIPRMSALECLRLKGDLLFQAFPYLLPIFASLRSIKMLIVEEAGEKSFELVRTLQSELVSAKILFPSEEFIIPSLPASNHPIQLLRQSASTLQNVDCGFWHDTHTNIQAVMSSPQIIFPNVHTLVLRIFDGIVPCLPPYIRAFPNLIHLRVKGNFCLPEETEFPSLLSFLSQNQNQDEINTSLRSLITEPLVLKHLQTYTGTLPALRALRIAFPISRLYFKPLTHDGPSARFGLTEVFAYARPIHLTIAFEDRPFSRSYSKDLLAALRSDGGSGLQSLSLAMDVMAADVEEHFDICQFGTTLENTLSRLQLCSLEIIMRDASVPETASAAAPPSPEVGSNQTTHMHEHVEVTARHPPDSTLPGGMSWIVPYSEAEAEHRARFTLAEHTLEDFDVRAFIDRLAASIPTLQRAVVSIERPSRWAGGIMRTAWLCERNGRSGRHANSTETAVLYEEYRVTPKAFEREEGWWASIARGWHRGLRSEI